MANVVTSADAFQRTVIHADCVAVQSNNGLLCIRHKLTGKLQQLVLGATAAMMMGTSLVILELVK